MSSHWELMRRERAIIALPEEIVRTAAVTCFDCDTLSMHVPWHPVGCECASCGSFNTSEVSEAQAHERESKARAAAAAAAAAAASASASVAVDAKGGGEGGGDSASVASSIRDGNSGKIVHWEGSEAELRAKRIEVLLQNQGIVAADGGDNNPHFGIDMHDEAESESEPESDEESGGSEAESRIETGTESE